MKTETPAQPTNPSSVNPPESSAQVGSGDAKDTSNTGSTAESPSDEPTQTPTPDGAPVTDILK